VDEIIMTNGASEALDTTLRSIINPGDEIIIPSPTYAGYIPLIQTLGAVPKFIDTTETSFKITPELLNQYINENTKA
ncbi:aminotransferase class I/II-fold pyridoxal phosphate-dependent enzyme, partial [Staphylococcus epidermidis]